MAKVVVKNRELLEYISIASKRQLKNIFFRPSPVVVQLFADITYQILYNPTTVVEPQAREHLAKYKKFIRQLAAKTGVSKTEKNKIFSSKGHLFLSELAQVILKQPPVVKKPRSEQQSTEPEKPNKKRGHHKKPSAAAAPLKKKKPSAPAADDS